MNRAAPATPDPQLADALAAMEREDPVGAEAAAEAVEWMVGAGGLRAVSQAGLQQFIWYELPFKWFGGPIRHRVVVAALARLFDLVGLGRYAALCRDPATDEVIRAFAVDAADGFDRFQAFHRASGVVPPDLPDLTWGELMGPAEFEAFWSCAVSLELAVAAGEVTADRGGAGDRAALVRAHLNHARPERFGETRLQEIETERITAWYDDPLQRARAQLLEPAVVHLLTPPIRPPSASRALRPLHRLLGCAAAGTAWLTATGRLTPKVVAGLAPINDPTRREDQVDGAALWRALVLDRRLVRRAGCRLVLTRRGREALESIDRLWSEAAAYLGSGGRGADATVAELVLGQLLVADGEVTIGSLVRPVQVAWAEDPRRRGGRPPADAEVTGQVSSVLAVARSVGAVRRPRRSGIEVPVQLTVAGVYLVRRALRTRALRARTRRTAG